LALAALSASLGARAAEPISAVIETRMQVPVALYGRDGVEVRQTLTVTIVRQAAAGRRPFLVLLHGRPVDARARAALGVQSYPANSRYFASRGFVVLIPTRVGYGVSHGPDVEYTGECDAKRFEDGVQPALTETSQLLDFATGLPFVDADRGIIVGESFGGLAAIAAASGHLRGVVAAVNVSGGDGGDSIAHVDQPCRPDRLQSLFADYGASNRLPTLWLYSANDRFWGPSYPRRWYAAFRAAGGRGSFVDLPADKNNGHFIFNRNAPAWRPAFEAFTRELELAPAAR
jgi:dienelactone hydrolase